MALTYIFLLKQNVSYYVSKDTPLLSAFLDASKEFDRTKHNLVFAELSAMYLCV